jgi:hypothetical protein
MGRNNQMQAYERQQKESRDSMRASEGRHGGLQYLGP